MKIFLTPVAFGEMQIKTIMRYHYTFTRMAKIKNSDIKC